MTVTSDTTMEPTNPSRQVRRSELRAYLRSIISKKDRRILARMKKQCKAKRALRKQIIAEIFAQSIKS
jgi:hypothetical protein